MDGWLVVLSPVFWSAGRHMYYVATKRSFITMRERRRLHVLSVCFSCAAHIMVYCYSMNVSSHYDSVTLVCQKLTECTKVKSSEFKMWMYFAPHFVVISSWVSMLVCSCQPSWSDPLYVESSGVEWLPWPTHRNCVSIKHVISLSVETRSQAKLSTILPRSRLAACRTWWIVSSNHDAN